MDRQQWEYVILNRSEDRITLTTEGGRELIGTGGTKESVIGAMNRLGADGWELAQDHALGLIFKRPKP